MPGEDFVEALCSSRAKGPEDGSDSVVVLVVVEQAMDNMYDSRSSSYSSTSSSSNSRSKSSRCRCCCFVVVVVVAVVVVVVAAAAVAAAGIGSIVHEDLLLTELKIHF